MNLLRNLEKTKKYGYLFYISYDGTKFDCFDENPGKNSVKKYFSDILKSLNITWAKGIQQAGRTDSKVSANENILYISTWFNSDTNEIIQPFNNSSKYLKINKIVKTMPNLVLPEIVDKRVYSYKVKKKYQRNSGISKKCEELSGKYDLNEFTDSKGKRLKQLVRDIDIRYEEDKLIFTATSFLPKQIRIMSAYILIGERKIFPAKPLTLEKISLKPEIDRYIFHPNNLNIPNIIRAEKISDINVFYVKKENKAKMIGTNGKNIKELRKIHGKVVIKIV